MTSEWVINHKAANGVQANEFRVSTAEPQAALTTILYDNAGEKISQC
jgi:hypothetical protein